MDERNSGAGRRKTRETGAGTQRSLVSERQVAHGLQVAAVSPVRSRGCRSRCLQANEVAAGATRLPGLALQLEVQEGPEPQGFACCLPLVACT
jgi:hypothetical protein